MSEIVWVMGGGCLVLVVVCLIVKEQTENRIRQLRAQALGLRNEEKRLADRRKQLEQMESQLREVMLRTERAEGTLDQEFGTAVAKLEELYQRVRGHSSTVSATDGDDDGDLPGGD